MISVLDRVSLTSGIRSCYYSQRKVINYYSNEIGPYEVVEIVNRMDYKVDVDGVVGTYHANMLKQYVER